jgi:hypothetical protein
VRLAIAEPKSEPEASRQGTSTASAPSSEPAERTTVRALALLLVLTAGCGAAPEPSALTIGGTASDGTGDIVLTDGQEVELVPGSQGGFHVWLRVRASGLAPGPVTVQRIARRTLDEKLVLRATDRRELDLSADGGWMELTTAIPSFMCPTPVGVSVVGEPVRFELTVVDDLGFEATGTITLVPTCPAGQLAFCQSICTG